MFSLTAQIILHMVSCSSIAVQYVVCDMHAVRDMRALPGCIACHALWVRDMRDMTAYPF